MEDGVHELEGNAREGIFIEVCCGVDGMPRQKCASSKNEKRRPEVRRRDELGLDQVSAIKSKT